MIYIVGLGPGTMELLPLRVYKLLHEKSNIFFRTEKHPVVDELKQEGLKFDTFDYLYDEESNFDDVYEKIATKVVQGALDSGEIVFGVPGNPMVAEKTVEKIIRFAKEKELPFEIVPAMSFLEPTYTLLQIDPSKGLQIIDALSMPEQTPSTWAGCIITQVYDRMVASEVKLNLMELYPDEHEIVMIRAAGIPGEEFAQTIPLYELDRQPWIDYLTSVYVPPFKKNAPFRNRAPLDPLIDIMEQLRGPDGCPWDREQSHESLKRYLIEETYEVIDAIDSKNMHNVCEELGDLLLQIAFHAQLAKEKGLFDINDVIEEICEKLVRRHPHVFGNLKVKDSKEVNINWNKIKAAEKLEEGLEEESVLSGVPQGLPALLKAEKIQKKAAGVGFDWPNYRGAMEKVDEEAKELKQAIQEKDEAHIEEELGDLIFALVNLARFLNVDPEEALSKTNNKFRQRFEYIEAKAKTMGKALSDMSLEEMDNFWEESKKC